MSTITKEQHDELCVAYASMILFDAEHEITSDPSSRSCTRRATRWSPTGPRSSLRCCRRRARFWSSSPRAEPLLAVLLPRALLLLVPLALRRRRLREGQGRGRGGCKTWVAAWTCSAATRTTKLSCAFSEALQLDPAEAIVTV
ncbi:hypothetical protein GQ600_23794 [Phytophthora cactorum]|nr:hypothetical protein GQ600_23794 [Phytophthora cactorum]